MSTNLDVDVTRLSRVSDAVTRHIGPDKLAGATTLIARGGEVIHHEAQGLQSREMNTPMQKDSIFRIYSMTKPITSVAAMMLHEAGAFQLSHPISRYLPAARSLKVLDEESGSLVDLNREITIRDLLSHTAGFTYGFSEIGRVEAMYRKREVFGTQSLPDFVTGLLELPLAFQPGSQWRYSVATDVLAHVVELAGDQRFDEFLSERILRPLGMLDTGFLVPEEKHDRLVSMYGSMNIEDSGMTGALQLAAAERGEIRLLAGPHDSKESARHDIIRGGHGLVSTARDYFRFCQMMLNGGELDSVRILGRKSIELMTRNTLLPELLPFGDPPAIGVGWGLGFAVLMDNGLAGSIGSTGLYQWGGAASTRFWIDPAEQLIGIQMAQFQPGGFFPIGDDFFVATYQALV